MGENLPAVWFLSPLRESSSASLCDLDSRMENKLGQTFVFYKSFINTIFQCLSTYSELLMMLIVFFLSKIDSKSKEKDQSTRHDTTTMHWTLGIKRGHQHEGKPANNVIAVIKIYRLLEALKRRESFAVHPALLQYFYREQSTCAIETSSASHCLFYFAWKLN